MVLMGVTMVVEEVDVEVFAVWPELTVVLELTVSVDLRDMSEVKEAVEVLDKDRSSLDGERSWQPMDDKLTVGGKEPSSEDLGHCGLGTLITGVGLWGLGDGLPA